MPNFVRLRTVAQMLSQRAQCYLLLGQPEAAWHELALVRDMCRMLEGKPASNAAMLVQAMIDVAITGLYTSIIEDGLRLQVWREPELAAMQKQLKDINLLPLVRAAFNAERAACAARLKPPRRRNLRSCLSSARTAGAVGGTQGSKIPAHQVCAARLDISEHVHGCPAGADDHRRLSMSQTTKSCPTSLRGLPARLAPPSWHRSPYTFLVGDRHA